MKLKKEKVKNLTGQELLPTLLAHFVGCESFSEVLKDSVVAQVKSQSAGCYQNLI